MWERERMKKKARWWISTENEVMQWTETLRRHVHSHVDSSLVSSSYSHFQHQTILGLWNTPYLSTLLYWILWLSQNHIINFSSPLSQSSINSPLLNTISIFHLFLLFIFLFNFIFFFSYCSSIDNLIYGWV